MRPQFLKNFVKCCDFTDRVLIRFIGERLIPAILIFAFLWIKYGLCKLVIGTKNRINTGFASIRPMLKSRKFAHTTCAAASVILILCTWATLGKGFAALPYYAGIFALIGWVITRGFGTTDSGFAAKKFLAYYALGIILFICAGRCIPQTKLSSSLYLASLCIFSATHPFHGWIEHFFSHAPSHLIATFLLFFRPAVWFFASQLLPKASPENYQFFSAMCGTLGIIGCLFVPILFLPKNESRKLLGYMVCWSNGILCLLLPILSQEHFELLLWPQSSAFAALALIFIEAQKHLHGKDLIGFKSPYFTKRHLRITAMLLSLAVIWPLILLACTWQTRLPLPQSAAVTISCLLCSACLIGKFSSFKENSKSKSTLHKITQSQK